MSFSCVKIKRASLERDFYTALFVYNGINLHTVRHKSVLHSEWGLVKCVMSSVDKIRLHQPWKAWLLSSGVLALRLGDVIQALMDACT